MHRAWVTAALVTIAAACSSTGAEIAIPAECNGAVSLCQMTYDTVVYPTTHNAMSSDDLEWQAANHHLGIKQQLADGVRGLMLDAHWHEGAPHLCHAVCQLGNTPLADGLSLIAEFLRNNRGEVVTLIFESYVSPAQMLTAFSDSGLLAYVFTQPPGQPWPTLRQLIDANTRLVVFTDNAMAVGAQTDAYPWYMNVWDHAWETHFAARTTFDLSCAPNSVGDLFAAVGALNGLPPRSPSSTAPDANRWTAAGWRY